MTDNQFFKKYPKAIKAYRVGSRLFFEEYEQEARRYAMNSQQELQVITKSKAKK